MFKEVLKSIVVFSFACLCTCCLVGCSDSDGGGSGDDEITEYKMSDLVGTWEIVHTKYTRKNNGKIVDSGSENVANEHDRFVFYSNGYFEFLEYDGGGNWHEDGRGTFYLRNGNFVFEGNDFEDARILSLSKTKLVVKYKVTEEKGSSFIETEYIDTMERIDSNAGGDEDVNGGDTGFKMSDIVGTWEIVHSKYVYKKDGKIIDAASMDVADEHNRFVFYSSGYFEFLEYDGGGKWHEDGKGTFYLRNGNFIFEGDFSNAEIISLSKTKLVARYTIIEEIVVLAGKEYTMVERECTETMERIN